jgi:glyoxylase-like metal-dependent hydrolase (beta-lactamase superfamily II)
LYHARAETDDATWVFVPELKTVFVGDLIIAGYPNIGNTWVYFMEQDREFLKSKGVV